MIENCDQKCGKPTGARRQAAPALYYRPLQGVVGISPRATRDARLNKVGREVLKCYPREAITSQGAFSGAGAFERQHDR